MAGHSKWANIKHQKAKVDAKRGKVFTKIIRELVVAAKEGGGNADDNPRLRLVMDKAFAANMKKDTIQKAVDRGAGNSNDENYEFMRYEGYAPGGVAIIVDCLTDNKNRTAGEVRHAFNKHGGNLGTDGSVAYLFEKQGQIYFYDFDIKNKLEDLMNLALEADASDIEEDETANLVKISTSFENFQQVIDYLKKANFVPNEASMTMEANLKIDLDLEAAQKVVNLIDFLEDLDDVQEVYSNIEISDEVASKLE